MPAPLCSIDAKTRDRFWAKVSAPTENDCWEWTASVTRDGYGRFRLPTKHVSAHRFAYELTISAIPIGLDLDHLCRNRRCVNPLHLEPVTERENTLRGVSAAAVNAAKTHCKRGHELSGSNVAINSASARVCRTCARAAQRAYDARQRSKRAEA